ncbi:hypothetical protein HNQ96_004379 [Aminobacter lissarensis]|uniref:Calcium-binding protein n=2 Tax=Aminobacter carboxidus TaxID=376165 RepID=A0A8E1WGK0_9HYPH|nr:hypothetical protein [Aminobacter lissarensis]
MSVTDATGDSDTTPASIVISIVDDIPVLGTFDPAIIPNQVGSVSGTFDLEAGADKIDHFNITGPAISGVTYSTTTATDGTTTLLAESSNGTDIYSLVVRPDGTYAFNLIQPDVSINQSISFAGFSSGGPVATIDASQTSTPSAGWRFDGLKFTGTSPTAFTNPNDGGGSGGDYLNVSGNGFGLGSASAVQDNRGFLFYQAGGASAFEFFADLTSNASSATITWAVYGGTTPPTASSIPLETSTTAITITSDQDILIDPTVTFTYLVVRVDAAGPTSAGIRVQDFEVSKTILPADQSYDFQIVAVDNDGDVSGTQALHVNQVAAGSAGIFTLEGTSADEFIAGSTAADAISGGAGFDVVDYTGSVGAISINLDESGGANVATTFTATPADGRIGGGDAAGDTLSGVEGLIGGSGNDVLIGNSSANYLAGGLGDDTLRGEAGADILFGGDGNDLIIGGAGQDTMTGGAGNDTFVIDPEGLTLALDDLIADYSAGDTIDLTDIFATFAAGDRPDIAAEANSLVNLVNDGTNTSVMVDDNGLAAGGTMVAVATLAGVHTTITVLYDDNQPTTPVT